MENERLTLKKYEFLEKLKLEGLLWEFIRRNEDYKKLYKEFSKLSKYFKNLNFYELPLDKIFREFKMKLYHYGLKYPLDPSKQANEIKDIKAYFKINQIVDILCMDDHPDRELCWEDIEATGHKLAVLIDLKASKKKIKTEIENIIKKGKNDFKSFKKHNPKVNITNRKIRSRTDDWYHYLIAYDLKIIHKNRIREIADILKPNLHKNHSQKHTSACGTCKNVRRYIKEASQLINSKYKKFLPINKTTK